VARAVRPALILFGLGDIMAAKKVLVCDNDKLVRNGLQELLRSAKKLTVCGTAADAEEAVRLARRLSPDVVVSSEDLPGVAGMELTRRLKTELPGIAVLLRGFDETMRGAEEARAAGAMGYLPKSQNAKLIVEAVEQLAEGKTFFGSSSPAEEPTPQTRTVRGSRRFRLTPREREVVLYIADGQTSKEIASRLGISVKTVETHRSNLMRKLGLHSVSDTVRYAIRHGIITP
jgi:DNA-binding NarL/FixJ family response regulator